MLSLLAFAFLEHVLDGGLVDHQISGAGAVQLNAVLVVPLDIAVDFLAVAQHDDHGRLRLHLLLIIKIFGVSLFGGRGLLGRSGGTVSVFVPIPISVSAFGGRVVVAVAVVIVLGAIEGRTDQLAVREAVLIGGLFSGYGVDCIFQIAPPARRAAKSATTLEPELWVQRCELRVTVSQRTKDDNILCSVFCAPA